MISYCEVINTLSSEYLDCIPSLLLRVCVCLAAPVLVHDGVTRRCVTVLIICQHESMIIIEVRFPERKKGMEGYLC